jgi:hypothetical protein
MVVLPDTASSGVLSGPQRPWVPLERCDRTVSDVCRRSLGEVRVSWPATTEQKVRFLTLENVG